jgi:serine/threonine protein kinase/Tol biopolymer transport system component
MMTPERWRQVTDVFQAALAHAPASRDAFLDDACRHDAGLRSEVDVLLAAHVNASALDRPIAGMPLAAGARIGPYRLDALIGEGGMGQVFRAHDTALGRDVAIKLLPPHLTSDPQRRARFAREARLLASLDHAHIARVHGFETREGVHALVMELIDGETLGALIAGTGMPVSRALVLARQIADALDAAHDHGIVHRDLKPANIKVTPAGEVKVLDFGLAKASDPGSGEVDADQLPTVTADATRQGLILGTPAYMSPEQARGQRTDKRTDIWAFGCVLYEMLCGRGPFMRETVTDTLAAVLGTTPDWTALPASTPAAVRRLLQRCLEKDPQRRMRDIGDVRVDLDLIDEANVAAMPQVSRTNVRSIRLWQAAAALMALMALIALAFSANMFGPRAVHSASRVDVALPDGMTRGDFVSVSPDGRKVIVTSTAPGGLWVRDLGSLEWRQLTGTDGAQSPFWSPDGRYVAFAVGAELKKVDATGGPPETLCSVPGSAVGFGSWNRDGVIIFGSWGGGAGGPLWKVSQAGGTATALTEVNASKGELYHTWPTFLEDGTHFLYFRSGPPEVAGIYAGSLDTRPADQPQTRILANALTANYANGYLFFMRAMTMMAQPFDGRRLQLTGDAVAIADAIRTTWFGTGMFSVSSAGALAYVTAPAVERSQLTWVDRQGKMLSTVGPAGPDGAVSLSPDGKRAVVRDADYGVPGDLWTVDLSDGRRTRLTFRGNNYSPGVWSHDGTRIAYAGGNVGDTVYEKASSGTGEEIELLKEPGTRHFVTSWSRDGRFLLYHTENSQKTGYDVWVLPLEGERKPVLLLGESFNEWAAQFSPDGRWIVYASTETGGDIFVRPFAVSASGTPALREGKWQVSRDGGNWPVWRDDREILFTAGLPWIAGTPTMAVTVSTSPTVFESGNPQRLFPSSGGSAWDATMDGQRFLVNVPQVRRAAPASSISVILDWPALLKP